MAEVYRAGIEAVPRGQTEAARSLGMSHGQAMRYVIVPQAVRKVIPPLLNDLVALMKDTSLVSVISLPEAVQVVVRHPVEDVQQLGADPGGVHVPDRDDPDGAAGRLADRTASSSAPSAARRPVATKAASAGSRCRPAAPARGRASSMATMEQSEADRRRPTGRCSAWRASASASASSRSCAASTWRSPKGEVVCVIGPSGSGKSTLLRCINLLEPPERRPDLPGGQGDHRQGRRGGRRLRPPAGRDGVPAVQPVPAQVRARERVPRPGEGARALRRRRRRRRRRRCWTGSGSPTSSTSTRTASRAASSSGSRSPARWRWTRT